MDCQYGINRRDPWAKVRSRRYFYANTHFLKRNFEYHATGNQLFLGHILTMAILLSVVAIEVFTQISSKVLVISGSISVPWIIWRSLKFQRANTSFSGVRFSFTPGLGNAYVNFLFLPLVLTTAFYLTPSLAFLTHTYSIIDGSNSTTHFIAISLGVMTIGIIALTWGLLKRKNNEFRISGTSLGQAVFSSRCKASGFATIAFKTACVSILTIATLMAASVASALNYWSEQELLTLISSLKEIQLSKLHSYPEHVIILACLALPIIFSVLISYSYFKSRQRRYILENTLINDRLFLFSDVNARGLIWIILSNTVLLVITLGLGFPWAKVRYNKFLITKTDVSTRIDLNQFVTEQQQYQSSLGEQIADAFNLDLGLGL